MLDGFLKFLVENKLCTKEERILLAVSGGLDSMVMLDLFRNGGFNIGVVHLNYGLRGLDSDEDENIVKEYTKKYKIPFHNKQVSDSVFSDEGSIQMIARDVRYHFFNELMAIEGYHKVATAHHLNDSLETVLMNLVRGTGISGLKGIPIVSGTIIRPLMFSSRKEILEYAKVNGVVWREDESNKKNIYQRNLIRNEVIPILEKINPSLHKTFEETLKRLSGAAQVIHNAKADFLAQFSKHTDEFIVIDSSIWSDDLKSLVMIWEITSDYGFNFTQAQNIQKCVVNQQSGRAFYSDGYLLNVDRKLIFIKEQRNTEVQEELIIEEDERAAIAFGKKITISKEPFSQLPKPLEARCAYLDGDKVTFPLTLRRWKEGDKFVPFGMKGKKMVSDFMIDNKIPVSLKRDILVLESGNEIAWLVNLRVSDRFKVIASTRTLITVMVTDHD